MTRTTKVLAVLVGMALVMVMGTGIMVAGTAVSSGLMTVSVHEEGPDGVDLYIPVPAGLVEVALGLAPVVLQLVDQHHDLDHELRHVRAELRDVLPVVEAMLDELADMPDAVLVEVDGDHEYVRVSKQGRSLEVLVEEGGNRVAVRIPTRVFRSLSGFLAG